MGNRVRDAQLFKTPLKPLHVWALAFREERTSTPQEFANYRRLLAQYAYEPLPWLRKLSNRC